MGRRKNTFIKIARDHRNALVYGRVQMEGGRGGIFDRRGMSFSFFFSYDKMERLT